MFDLAAHILVGLEHNQAHIGIIVALEKALDGLGLEKKRGQMIA